MSRGRKTDFPKYMLIFYDVIAMRVQRALTEENSLHIRHICNVIGCGYSEFSSPATVKVKELCRFTSCPLTRIGALHIY